MLPITVVSAATASSRRRPASNSFAKTFRLASASASDTGGGSAKGSSVSSQTRSSTEPIPCEASMTLTDASSGTGDGPTAPLAWSKACRWRTMRAASEVMRGLLSRQ